MNKPIKPNITIPQSFAENGVKTDFDDTLLADGFDNLRPDVLAGDNLNKFIDDTYQGLNYGMAAADAINLINEGETLTVVDGKLTSGASGGGLEIGDIGFTQIAIDETKGKRRKLNGQLIIQDQYVQFTNIIKNSVALNSDLACTEEEWQTEVTMSTNGICSKFVIDDDAGTIRLPKYPSYFIGGVNGIAPVVGNGNFLGLYNPNGWKSVNQETSVVGFMQTSDSQYNEYMWGSKSKTGDLSAGVVSDVEDPGNATKNRSMIGVHTNPAYSGIEAQIKQEKIVGTYFIQVATGSETKDNIINEIELNNPFSLLDYKYSEYELNNLSWLRSEGQYNSKAIYSAVYDLLLKIYNGTETKAGVSVKLSTETFTDYDFVLNTAEETFRLPVKVKLASGKAVVGNGIALGFSGIANGNFAGGLVDAGMCAHYESGANGYDDALFLNTAFIGASLNVSSNISMSTQYLRGSSTTGSSIPVGITSDPTISGIETSDSDLYLYFYVGETVQNANLINAGRIEEKLVDKLDRSSVKAYIVETYVNGASGYKVYSNGYCEQWGTMKYGATLGGGKNWTTNVALLLPFVNTDYIILLTYGFGTSTDESGGQEFRYNKKTNSSFQAGLYNRNSNTAMEASIEFNWQASGYIN